MEELDVVGDAQETHPDELVRLLNQAAICPEGCHDVYESCTGTLFFPEQSDKKLCLMCLVNKAFHYP
jgi:hypothetical protein